MWMLEMKNAADVRTILLCMFKVALFAVVWELYPQMNWVAKSVAFVAQSVAAFCVAALVHNAMHCDVFLNRSAEFVWRVILTWLFGFPVEAYKPTHNANHHVYTQHENDHLHTSQMKYKWHFLNLIMFFPQCYAGITKLEQEFMKKEWQKKSATFFYFACQCLACWSFTILLLYLNFGKGMMTWFLPNVMGADCIITMNMLQHDGCDDIVLGKHRGKELEVNSARNFVGPVINWITCNNGYHQIHHMYTNTHWTEYPALHDKLVAPYNEPELNQQCILRYLFRTYFWPGTLPAHRQLDADAEDAKSK
eukprot:TRINITY_DN9000_c0_g1_i1.p1 TRINITY_DN9000_c0_g1~~TRINITY_DN9000_c0_g1_i1.p1  ORF type:complete len:307 (-),score=49.64 TRINITY_DN9000_c0_g1_i1:227-1147(-)